jgi:urea transporter
VLRGIGQVFFQEHALTGACFLLGIAASSPLMALGAIVGSAIGYGTARLANFDAEETAGGIYGFNPTLVGIATFFFFQPGVVSVLLMLVGCVAATFVTWAMRRHLPFPTYTAPFILVTWAVWLLARAMNAPASAGYPALIPTPDAGLHINATAHGISQVMFQASLWTGLLFLLGIALSNPQHAIWVWLGAVLGALVGAYHASAATRTLDPERLVERALTENIALGLYGYNATLAAVALWLWRPSLIPPLLGAFLAVLLTELFPLIGLPALTAPFVLATWIVLACGWFDRTFLHPAPATGR